MNPSTRQVHAPSGVNEKLSEGPSSLWMAAVVILVLLQSIGILDADELLHGLLN